MGQHNQKDKKGPKMTTAVILVQNNQIYQKIWSPHISLKFLKVRAFGTPCKDIHATLRVFLSLSTGMFVTIFALTTHSDVKFSFV